MPVSVLPYLADTYGTLLIGNILASWLYGFSTLQTYIYYGRSRGDSLVLKGLVGSLWILDSLHTVLISHVVYVFAITNYGNLESLGKPQWSFIAQGIVSGIGDAIVRGVFCYRIWTLSNRNFVITGINILCSVAVLCQDIILWVHGVSLPPYIRIQIVYVWLPYSTLAMSLVADAVIAATMALLLARSQTHFRKVNNVVRTLIMHRVSTGAIAALWVLGFLIAYAALPQSFVFVAFKFTSSKLLFNSLLAMLNSRNMLRDQLLAPEANVLPSAADGRFKSLGARNPNDSDIMQQTSPLRVTAAGYSGGM
ncbi:hypothetical protein L227DRAFT_650703 [Lentinus tigrinus ALCF2SS1-6]|uniref:DUF6534 domain-containing protein n=1 Tax=Lentinus tigrinus ALCF2SS1-6 TaxID=1328759 RepID=A0A5C2SIM9_9APHY|nr:hypothetical protein L227DRAFT_650703 [Lentinus tigrinus ALCF2SS1-6]